MRKLALTVGLLLMVACGDDATDALSETAANLEEITSGDLAMSFVVSSEGSVGEAETGFELHGPFALPEEEGELPTASIVYTRLAGDEEASVTFISTGEAAYVDLDGTVYELPPENVEELSGASSSSEEGIFGDINLGDWMQDPEISDGPDVQGASTDLIRSDLDAVEAFNDLIGIAESFAGGDVGLPLIEGSSAEQLENAVEEATIELYTGTEDRYLRRLVVDVDFGIKDRAGAPENLSQLAGARMSVEMEIADPNGEVTVEEPEDALPYTELPTGTG